MLHFLKIEKIEKPLLATLVNKITVDKHKNIKVYFNFNELNYVNELGDVSA